MPPEGVVEAGLAAVKRYLLDVQEAKEAGADVTSLQLLKVVLVGSSSAGKTRWAPAPNKGMAGILLHVVDDGWTSLVHDFVDVIIIAGHNLPCSSLVTLRCASAYSVEAG